MQHILTLAFALAMIAGAASAAPTCKTGVPCGDTCIAAGKTCHIVPRAPHCTKGKLCGNTCIKATDVCHAPPTMQPGAVKS